MSAYKLVDLISTEKFNEVLKSALPNQEYELKHIVLRNASDGLLGHSADHLKLKVSISVMNNIEELNFFIKCVPKWNIPKRKQIKQAKCFEKEAFMYQMFADSGKQQDWHPKVFYFDQELLIMSDLSIEGYRSPSKYDYLDLNHCKLVLESMAKFHAISISYEINKSSDGNYRIIDEFGEMLQSKFSSDGPALKTGNKLIYDCFKTFLKVENITEEQLYEIVLGSCESVRCYDEAINVIIHKDLWANNMLIKYDEYNNPIKAVLIDFQCIKYAPPAFDVMCTLYFNTTKTFREKYNQTLIKHYIDALNANFEKPVLDEIEFERWIEKARLYGLVSALLLFPFILPDEETSKQIYDNPETYYHVMNVDRSEPFIEFCHKSKVVKERFVALCEELVELIS